MKSKPIEGIKSTENPGMMNGNIQIKMYGES